MEDVKKFASLVLKGLEVPNVVEDKIAWIASKETDDGPLDIYSPVEGKIIEINTAVVEDPSLISEDPHEAWFVKIESDEDLDEDEEDDEDEEEEEEEFEDEE